MSSQADRPSPDEMSTRLERMEQSAEQLLAKFEELQGELGAESVEVYSEDGLIRVKLDSDGHVAEIELHEVVMRYRNALGEGIRHTIAQAKQTHADRTAEVAQRLLGGSFDLQAVLDRYRS